MKTAWIVLIVLVAIVAGCFAYGNYQASQAAEVKAAQDKFQQTMNEDLVKAGINPYASCPANQTCVTAK